MNMNILYSYNGSLHPTPARFCRFLQSSESYPFCFSSENRSQNNNNVKWKQRIKRGQKELKK